MSLTLKKVQFKYLKQIINSRLCHNISLGIPLPGGSELHARLCLPDSPKTPFLIYLSPLARTLHCIAWFRRNSTLFQPAINDSGDVAWVWLWWHVCATLQSQCAIILLFIRDLFLLSSRSFFIPPGFHFGIGSREAEPSAMEGARGLGYLSGVIRGWIGTLAWSVGPAVWYPRQPAVPPALELGHQLWFWSWLIALFMQLLVPLDWLFLPPLLSGIFLVHF